jgi:GTPase SAR1 family protein
MYYKDIHGVILVFDLTDEDSFRNMTFWLSDLNKHAPENIVKILAGNKFDLTDPSQAEGSFNSKRQV